MRRHDQIFDARLLAASAEGARPSPRETAAARATCDASMVAVLLAGTGHPLDGGRRTRAIPAVRRPSGRPRPSSGPSSRR